MGPGSRPAVLVLAIALLTCSVAKADAGIDPVVITGTEGTSGVEVLRIPAGDIPSQGTENKRWVAATLTIFLGPFGAHRLYLGTTAKVPVVYGITFGGFGVLALIDLGHILFTHDLSRFEHNDRVFMWAKPRTATTPP